MEETISTKDRLKELRQRLKLSQEQLSKRCGIAFSSISRWESGVTPTIKLSSIKKIADACNVNPLWLLGYDVPFEKRTPREEELEREISDLLMNLNEEQLLKLRKFIEEFL